MRIESEAIGVKHALATDGYFILPAAVPKDGCGDLLARLRRAAPPLDWKKGYAAAHVQYLEVAQGPALLESVVEILGENVLVWGARLVARAAGARHDWHVDVETSDPACRALSIWIGLENTSRDTGLRVVSGSHRFGHTVQQRARESGHGPELSDEIVGAWARQTDPLSRIDRLRVGDGDAVVFDGRIWHASSNTSRSPRTALLLQFAASGVPIRIPSKTEWPFRFQEIPRPPCVLVHGAARGAHNRIVAPPSAPRTKPQLTGVIASGGNGTAEEKAPGWRSTRLFRGSTATFDLIGGYESHLTPSSRPHDMHSHQDEEIIYVRSGELTVDNLLPRGTSSTRLGAGDLVFYPPMVPHTLCNNSSEPVNYVVIKWNRTRRTESIDTVFSRVHAPDSKPNSRGLAKRRLFECRTSMLDRLELHTSTLAPGGGYPPHEDSYDVCIVMVQGEAETLGQRVLPGDVVFVAAGLPHGMRNPGPHPALYLVIEFHARHVARSEPSTRPS